MAKVRKGDADNYDASSIKHKAGASAVRAKVTMYLGDKGEKCFFTAVREACDNVVDEALNGHANQCAVFHDKDGFWWVADNGRGIPAGSTFVEDPITEKKIKMPALRVATGFLHGGAKLEAGTAYAVSRGTHGIGVKGTNFVSHSFEVWSCFKGDWHSMLYEEGRVVRDVGKCKAPKLPDGRTMSKGTLLKFKPDAKVVGASSFPAEYLHNWGKLAALFTDKLTVSLHLYSKKSMDFKRTTYCFPNGPREFVDRYIESAAKQGVTVQLVEKDRFEFRSPLADVVLAWSNLDDCNVLPHTNGLLNGERGVHYDSVRAAVHTALLQFAPKRGNKDAFNVTEACDGLLGLVNMKLSSPEFSGQTKDKLVDARAGTPFKKELQAALVKFFSANKAFTARVVKRALELKKVMGKFHLDKAAAKEIEKATKAGPPKGAMLSHGYKPEDIELYVTEGDSAATPMESVRLPWQECCPLKGKPINAMRNDLARVVKSEVVMMLLSMIGFNPKAKDPLSELRVRGKIILLPDPDADGAHIATLDLALLYRIIPQVFDAGLVYVCRPPLCYAEYKGQLVPSWTGFREVRAKLDKMGAPANQHIQYIKGYGEMSLRLFTEFALKADTRRLEQIKFVKKNSAQMFSSVMSEDMQVRREMMGIVGDADDAVVVEQEE